MKRRETSSLLCATVDDGEEVLRRCMYSFNEI